MSLIVQEVTQPRSHGGCQSPQWEDRRAKALSRPALELQVPVLHILWVKLSHEVRETGERRHGVVFTNYQTGKQGLQEQRVFTWNWNEEEESFQPPARLTLPSGSLALIFFFIFLFLLLLFLSPSLHLLLFYLWCGPHFQPSEAQLLCFSLHRCQMCLS